MKLEPVTFYGAFEDGLLLIEGHEFEVAGRKYVVHRGREPFEKEYHVSEMGSGFRVPIITTRNRSEAVRLANEKLDWYDEEELSTNLKTALKRRSRLKIIEKQK